MAKQMPANLGDVGAQRIATRAIKFDAPSEKEATARKSARLQQISAFKLKPHRLQPPARHADDNVRELMESIHSIGLQEPPLVRRTPTGEYVILAGHRRVHAWKLLAVDGRVEEKIRAFVLSDIDDRDAIYIITAEFAHRRDFDVLHTAQVIGAAYEERCAELGREPSAHELADVIPWGESSIAAYRKVYEALREPQLAPLIQRLERPHISLLYKVLCVKEFPKKVEALEAFAANGKVGAERVLKGAKRGATKKTVTRSKRKDGYDLTVRVRSTHSAQVIQAQLDALEAVMEELRRTAVGLEQEQAA
jgi:ParB/RepB/Spo0J family partition protein